MIIGITGSTGGLGRKLTEYILERGYSVKCLVRKGSDIAFSGERVEIVEGDICNPKSLEEFVKRINVCIHIAALVSSDSNEALTETNVNGTRNICQALVQYNIQCRLIHCSSIVVKDFKFYMKPLVSAYTMSKFKAEKVVDNYSKKLKTTIIYPGYILGKYDRALIPHIVNMLKPGLPFLVKGGEKNAPVVYADDLCELFYQSVVNEKSVGKKYISLEEQHLGMHDVIRIIANEFGYHYPNKVYSKTLARLYLSLNSIMAAMGLSMKSHLTLRSLNILSNHGKYFNNAYEDIGWEQTYDVESAVKKALEYYREAKGE